MVNNIPEDIENVARLQPEWFNVLRRMRSCARSGSPQVITMRVLVDDNGNPVNWNVWHSKLEGSNGLDELLKLFGR